MSQPQELVGTFVVEVGEREAWPFMTFCDDDTTPSREARLYIDTEWTVNRSNVWLSADELPTARLFRLNNLGVAAVSAGDAELSITFDDGGQMIVSGVASAWTMDQLRSEQPACRRIHRGSVSTIGIPGDGSRPLDPTSVLAEVTPYICYPFPYVDGTVQLCSRIAFLPILRVHACSRRRAGTPFCGSTSRPGGRSLQRVH